MALPTPVEMPSPLPVNSKMFDLNYNQSVSPAGSQFLQTIERAPPMWVAKYSTPNLSPETDSVFQAFLDSLEGSMVPFLAFDPRRPRPYAYRNIGGEPWVAAGQSAVRITNSYYSYDGGRGLLLVDRFANNATITPGDYISYQRGNQWYLHRVLVGSIIYSDGTGSLWVTPRPPTTGTDVNGRMTRACCAMKLIGKVQKDDTVEANGPKYSFSAIQFKDRSS